MQVVFISDTHGQHRNLKLPEADMLIHAGDMTVYGEIDILNDFDEWMGEQKFEYKIAIAGNHDLALFHNIHLSKHLFNNFIYLNNEGVDIEGLKIWGSPWTPFPGSKTESPWVFHKPRGTHIAENWKLIPENLDILITHGPPNRVLDRTLEGDYAGCVDMMVKLKEMAKPPKIHVFGHIHEANGMRWIKDTLHVNCSSLDRMYGMYPLPYHILEIKPRED